MSNCNSNGCTLQNPFGDAKPREAVLAQRTGKDEATVLKEDAGAYEIHLKLDATQFAEKKARQHEIEDLKSSLATGGEDQDAEQLKVCFTTTLVLCVLWRMLR